MKSWTLGKKLTIGFGSMLTLTLGLSWYSLHAIGTLGGALDANTARTMDLVGTVRLGLREMVEQAKSAQLTYVVSHIKRLEGVGSSSGMECTTCHTMDGFENSGREFADMASRIQEHITELRPSIADAKGKESLQAIEAGVCRWRPLYEEFLRDVNRNEYDEAHGVIRDKMYPILDEVDKAAKVLADGQRDAMIAAGKGASGMVTRSRWIAFLLIGLSLVMSALAPVVISGSAGCCARLRSI